MSVRYLIAACFALCALADSAMAQTAPRPPVARQAVVPNVVRNTSPDETWTIPDRNRVNEGTVTVITAPAAGATPVFGPGQARAIRDEGTGRPAPPLREEPGPNLLAL